MGKYFNKALKLTPYLIVRGYYLLTDLIDLFTASLVKEHIRDSVKEIQSGASIVIYAMLDASKKRNFIDYHVNILKENFDHVIVVNNCTNYVENSFYDNDAVDVIINRTARGRDISAYKSAVLHVSSKWHGIESVTFINDSIVITNKEGFKAFCTDNFEGYLGSTYSMQKKYHGQSFLFRVSNTVFYDKKFLTYWRSLRPVNSRYYAIKRGELGIFKTIKKMGCNIAFFYDYELIRNQFVQNGLRMKSKLARAEIDAMLSAQVAALHDLVQSAISTDVVRNYLDHHSSESSLNFESDMQMQSLAHEFGFDLAERDAIPFIKLELVSKGLANLHQYKSLVKDKLPGPVANSVCNQVIDKGLPHTHSFIKRLKISVGAA